MGEQTKIQWTDNTHNFWRGCTKVSAGCANCYAEVNVGVKMHGVKWGKGKPRVRSLSFDEPLKWNKKAYWCEKCGDWVDGRFCKEGHTFSLRRRRVFSLSLGDWLDDEVPIQWLSDMLDVMRRCQNLTWQLLTKRPENYKPRIEAVWELARTTAGEEAAQLKLWIQQHWLNGDSPIPSIWIGTSVENQATADERIPKLLQIPAAVRFLSCEPLLGPIDLQYAAFNGADSLSNIEGIHWVIVGGESGHHARPCNVEWVRNIAQQCRTARVPVFVKQLGSNCITDNSNMQDWPEETVLVGHGEGFAAARVKFRHPKGGDCSEWPEELQIRNFPKVI